MHSRPVAPVRYVLLGEPYYRPVEGGVARTLADTPGFVVEMAGRSAFVTETALASARAERGVAHARYAYYLSAPDRAGLWWARRKGEPALGLGIFALDGWTLLEVVDDGRGSLLAELCGSQRGGSPPANFVYDQWTPVAPPQPVAVDCDCPDGDAEPGGGA